MSALFGVVMVALFGGLGSDDEGAGGGFDDVVGDGVELVDFEDSPDLGEESFE